MIVDFQDRSGLLHRADVPEGFMPAARPAQVRVGDLICTVEKGVPVWFEVTLAAWEGVAPDPAVGIFALAKRG